MKSVWTWSANQLRRPRKWKSIFWCWTSDWWEMHHLITISDSQLCLLLHDSMLFKRRLRIHFRLINDLGGTSNEELRAVVQFVLLRTRKLPQRNGKNFIRKFWMFRLLNLEMLHAMFQIESFNVNLDFLMDEFRVRQLFTELWELKGWELFSTA